MKYSELVRVDINTILRIIKSNKKIKIYYSREGFEPINYIMSSNFRTVNHFIKWFNRESTVNWSYGTKISLFVNNRNIK